MLGSAGQASGRFLFLSDSGTIYNRAGDTEDSIYPIQSLQLADHRILSCEQYGPNAS